MAHMTPALDDETPPPMNHRPVYVEWLDASRSGEWVDLESVDAEPSPCQSVGFLVKESESAITVALTDGGNQVCCSMTIPRGMIVKILSLEIKPLPVGLQDNE